MFGGKELREWRIREDRCPVCGGMMMLKIDEREIFKGCVYFPKCHYRRHLTEEEEEQFPTIEGLT